MVRPRVGVVTTIGDDHIINYGSREAIAEEKGKLIEALPDNGTAVLNADDELVMAMRSRCAGRVVTYGLREEADVRGEDVSGVWPDRLSLTVTINGERLRLETQLCGTHLTHCVLAAVATGVSMGIPLRECIDALAGSPPFLARMEPITTVDGVTFIQDDWKAPLWTISSAFKFMEEARATRKVIVVGTLSDYGGDASVQYSRVARRALEIADHVVFVGAWASRALRAAAKGQRATLNAFSTVWQANEFPRRMLRPGDLVLLKGSNRKDHLRRIVLARTSEVRCWRDDCNRFAFCASCPSVSIPSGIEPSVTPRTSQGLTSNASAGKGEGAVVIGLGNPGPRYLHTPHNVSHEVLDALGRQLGVTWVEDGDSCIARTVWKQTELCLIKLQVGVNRSGPAIKKFTDQMALGSEDLVLVHDDLDLPLGTVRARMRGSAGGHRGVASVLDVFQTDAVRRVKIGIGRPPGSTSTVEYVLQPFSDTDRDVVERACSTASERILSIIATTSRAKPGATGTDRN